MTDETPPSGPWIWNRKMGDRKMGSGDFEGF
jgi:hypothetical protein